MRLCVFRAWSHLGLRTFLLSKLKGKEKMERNVVFTDETFIKMIEAQQKNSEDFADTVQRLCKERLNTYNGEFQMEVDINGQ